MATRKTGTKVSTNTQTKPKTETKADRLEKENQALKSELEEIKKMLANLNNASENTTKETNLSNITKSIDDEYVEIPLQKQIRVINLCNGKLVLSTEGYGMGRIYEFEQFGAIRFIPYQDLMGIVSSQQSFSEKGAFYILDKQVVKNCGLESFYQNIMDKKTIENILNVDNENFERIINNASSIQFDTIVGRVSDMLRNKEYVDYNKINIINKKYGHNIEELIA